MSRDLERPLIQRWPLILSHSRIWPRSDHSITLILAVLRWKKGVKTGNPIRASRQSPWSLGTKTVRAPYRGIPKAANPWTLPRSYERETNQREFDKTGNTFAKLNCSVHNFGCPVRRAAPHLVARSGLVHETARKTISPLCFYGNFDPPNVPSL